MKDSRLFHPMIHPLLLLMALTACQAQTHAQHTPTPVPSASPTLGSTPVASPVSPAPVGSFTVQADVWADNWFALYVDDKLVREDSVSINTERSFNAERFSFSVAYPFTLALVMKDYKANDTGLEYIGRPNQQMGDGGVIAQFKDVSGKLIAVSDRRWKCKVIHKAPLDTACSKVANPVAGQAPCTFTATPEPEGWSKPGFNDSDWAAASEFSRERVSPKDGYDQISWDASAKFIWGPDLHTDNTVLCRLTLTGP